jgi:hypothetical protein
LKIPFLLEKYLPIWEYICPKCRKIVKSNSHECLHCGEKYPLAIKVPPSTLKDPKKLEDYVHKNIFPKVSKSEREYLTKYFTVLFSDGFESGDFSAWDSVTGSPTISTEQVHTGTYCMQYPSSQYPSFAGLSKTFTGTSEFYVRAYFRFSKLPTINDELVYGLISILQASSGLGPSVRLTYKTSLGYAVFNCENGYWGGSTDGSTRVYADTWYCMELHAVQYPNNHEWWVDGVAQPSPGSGVYSTPYDIVTVGMRNYTSDSSLEGYVDCVVVSDAPIGVESAATLQTVADSVSLTDALLSNKTLIFNDSIAASDSTSRNKTPLIISDEMSFRDASSTPSRVLITLENLGLLENASINKVLAISDSASIVELVEVGKGAKKTRLFLVLGDLAIQISDN